MSAFLLIRHAQSTWNAGGRWQGQADPPLSESGETATAIAARRLAGGGPFDLVITSDLARARRTGEILAGGPGGAPAPTAEPTPDIMATDRGSPPVILEPALREFHVGHWSGLTRPEIEQRWPAELALFDEGRLAAPPGGEARADFDARVRSAARKVARLIHRHSARRTLIVAHGGVIRSLVRTSGLQERHVANLAGYEGAAAEDGLRLHHPVDLLHGEPADHPAGPVAL